MSGMSLDLERERPTVGRNRSDWESVVTAHPVVTSMYSVEDEFCPWCEQTIPHEKFDEIHKRIQANERARLAEVERRLRDEHQQRLAEITATSEAQVAKLQQKSVTDLANAAAAAKRDIANARAETKLEVDAVLALKVKQAEAAKRLAEQQLKTQQAEQDKLLAARLQEQRDALSADKDKALNAERAKAFGETQKLTDKLAALQRQLESKTADELGEGAEVDLFEALKHEFPGDRIARVKKGEAGADIIHAVIANERECGCIVYDSKNRSAWRNDYVTKLRADQLAAKADHAILVSRPFPSGSKQLHLQDGVIVANPARAIALVQLVRDHVVRISTLQISEKGRAQKMSKLYEFITSNHCSQLLAQMDQLSDDLLELDVKEKKAHDLTWKRRGELVRGVQQTRGNLVSEIDLIVQLPQADVGPV